MPLPTPGIEWPPKPFDTAFADMASWDAWYVGDPDRLSDVYSGKVPSIRPSQYRGGVVGALARFFWGRPIPVGQSRARIHVPVAADLATTSADLLFSEPPRIVIPGRRGTTTPDGEVRDTKQDRLELLLNGPDTHSELLNAAELAAVLGGTYLRIVWDKDAADRPLLTSVAADAAIPTWSWGRLKSVVFWTKVAERGQTVWRHFECHEKGRILHGLYEGTSTQLGHMVPFEDRPETEWLATLVDAEGAIPTGSDDLTAAYIPNILPNRIWRKTPGLAPMGRSDFDGLEGLFDALDEAWSSWMRDIRLSKARLVVNQQALRPLGDVQAPGAGQYFDADQEVFTEISGLGKVGDGSMVQAEQFAIRHEEHRATTIDLLKQILRGAGYSPGTFGDDPMATGGTTATEVKSRERLSERTRDKKARYWASELSRLAQVMLEVDQFVFGGPGPAAEAPEVRFPPKPQEDTLELAQIAETLLRAEAASIETRVRLVHPEWDGDTVDTEVEKILDESKADLADAFTLRPGVPEE